MKQRIERLEGHAPAPLVTVHLIGMRAGQSETDAIAAHDKPVGPDDEIIFLVGVSNADQ